MAQRMKEDFKKTRADLADAAQSPPLGRCATVERVTRETQIRCTLNLDGTGRTEIVSPIGFLSHMLEALARHAHFDLNMQIAGDLHVDQHHTVEDAGLVLGSALRQALGERRGIWRTGSSRFPMDEALADCAVDIAGRPCLVFEVTFARPFLGELQSDLVREFFGALALALGANVHLHVPYGENDHHKCEAMFKACGRALELATALHPRALSELPSTKGALDG